MQALNRNLKRCPTLVRADAPDITKITPSMRRASHKSIPLKDQPKVTLLEEKPHLPL